tara:strand:+ start:22 stop:582 length:561 start_codon:yes stop_codon:yes gene_type:complete
MIKLNLGCGSKKLKGYTNVDKFKSLNPDIIHDLETFPYPFDDNTVDEILLSHVLEHLGQNSDTFNKIIKEIYRICKNKAVIIINVPHPRHDDFLSDPTHVRPILPAGLELYDKELNLLWKKKGAANSQLGLIHNVNLKIKEFRYEIEEKYKKRLQENLISKNDPYEIMETNNNVIKSIHFKLDVIK